MIPLSDNVARRNFPLVTYALVAANAWIFLQELRLGRKLHDFMLTWGLVPKLYAIPGAVHEIGLFSYIAPFFTSMFLHGGWLHAISNMWILLIFGDNVEDKLGKTRYLIFYLASGVAAGLTQIWANWGSSIPTIGASGAIAGVMGAYFLLFPRARIVALIPIFIFLKAVEVPAFLFLGFWLWSQVYAGSHAMAGAGGVAWWAHVGGFLAGMLLLGLFKRR